MESRDWNIWDNIYVLYLNIYWSFVVIEFCSVITAAVRVCPLMLTSFFYLSCLFCHPFGSANCPQFPLKWNKRSLGAFLPFAVILHPSARRTPKSPISHVDCGCPCTDNTSQAEGVPELRKALLIVLHSPHLSPFSPLTRQQMVIKAPFIAFDNKSNKQFWSRAARQTNINKRGRRSMRAEARRSSTQASELQETPEWHRKETEKKGS